MLTNDKNGVAQQLCFVFRDLIFIGSQSYLERQSEEIALPICWLTAQMATTADLGQARSPELLPGLPCRYRTQAFGPFSAFPRRISRELDEK